MSESLPVDLPPHIYLSGGIESINKAYSRVLNSARIVRPPFLCVGYRDLDIYRDFDVHGLSYETVEISAPPVCALGHYVSS